MIRNGMSANSAQYCLDNWHATTIHTYQYKVFSWIKFCDISGLDPHVFSGEKVMEFLIFLFEPKGSTIKTIKSAYHVMRSLCNAAGCPVPRPYHKQINMLLNGMFKRRPGLVKAKKSDVWDISILLDFFSSWKSDNNLSLIRLGSKLACLIMLATMRRKIDLCQLDIKTLSWNADKTVCSFNLHLPTKTYNINTKPGRHQSLQVLTLQELKFDKFSPLSDLKICPVQCLKEYVKCTGVLRRDHSGLFVITCEPFSPTRDRTISRWVKSIMALAGIDINLYSPHSFRSASSSKASHAGISLSSIMQKAGWSCKSTFVDHYLRNVDASPAPPRPGPCAPVHHPSKPQKQSARRVEKFTSLWKDSLQYKPCATVSVAPKSPVKTEDSPLPLLNSADLDFLNPPFTNPPS